MQDIRNQFEAWLEHSYDPQARAKSALRILRRFKLCDWMVYDLASFRVPEAPGSGPLIIDLWTLRSARADKAALMKACAQFEMANCLKDQVREGLTAIRNTPPSQILLRANVVAPSVGSGPESSIMAEAGHRIRLWTHSFESGKLEVWPYCGSTPVKCKRSAGTLAGLLMKIWSSDRGQEIASAGDPFGHGAELN